MSRLRELVLYQAVRGDSVIVDDVLACDPLLKGADARAEMRRRACDCIRNFGEFSTDSVIRGRRLGSTYRYD